MGRPPDLSWRALFTCEHACNHVPAGVDLGVAPSVLDSHVAWDEGAVEVARAIAGPRPLFEGQVSRLVCDLNRREEDPGVIPAVAFGTPVPGNQALSVAAREARLSTWHRPWRQQVFRAVQGVVDSGAACLHLSVHSFTPVLHGQARTVQVGVLHDPARAGDRLWAQRLLQALRQAGLDARLDEPYRGTDEGFTTWLRERLPEDRYAGLELELNQALPPAARLQVARTVQQAVSGNTL